MLNWKCLGFTSLLSLGLIAACSSDSSTTPKDDAGTISEDLSGNTTNVCVYDGYAAMQGASGETLCLDTEGTLAFWINADGSYGFPEASQEGGESTPAEPNPNESAPVPSDSTAAVDNPADPINSGSANETESCTAEKALYTVNGISYYKNADGSLYYFDADCNKTSLTVTVPESSSSDSASEGKSSSSEAGVLPGRVEQPPISRIEAPSAKAPSAHAKTCSVVANRDEA